MILAFSRPIERRQLEGTVDIGGYGSARLAAVGGNNEVSATWQVLIGPNDLESAGGQLEVFLGGELTIQCQVAHSDLIESGMEVPLVWPSEVEINFLLKSPEIPPEGPKLPAEAVALFEWSSANENLTGGQLSGEVKSILDAELALCHQLNEEETDRSAVTTLYFRTHSTSALILQFVLFLSTVQNGQSTPCPLFSKPLKVQII